MASSILGFDYILNIPDLGDVNVDKEIDPDRARKLHLLSITTGLSIATILEKGIGQFPAVREAHRKVIPFPKRKVGLQ